MTEKVLKQREKKIANMRIFQNVLFVLFIVVLASHNFALRRDMIDKEQDLHEREVQLKNNIRELRLEQHKWRQGYADFEARKEEECKRILGN